VGAAEARKAEARKAVAMDKLVVLARNPVPSGAVVGTFAAEDGAHLRYARWDATRSPRRGTVCVFPGRGESIEKYFETIADLRRRGFSVAIMDWRGQGGSERTFKNPRKGYPGDFATHDADLLRFMKDVVLPDCPPPFLALGHSMGGHLLIRNAIATGSWFERIVVTAPMIRLHPDRVGHPALVVRTFAEIACLLGLAGSYAPGSSDTPSDFASFDDNPLTSDRERFLRNRAILEAAPDLISGGPTIGWLRAAFRSMAEMADPTYPERVLVPLLIFSAGRDVIVSSPHTEAFAMRLKVGTHIRLPTARHEILQETDEVRQRFWAAFDAYLGVDLKAA
jgi:lysophospholipase